MAVYLCCTCPEVAFGGCYPLSCPIKPGLSSYTAFRHCARGCSAYSDSHYTHSVPSLSSGGPVSGRPSGDPAPDHSPQLNHLPSFTIPPTRLRRHPAWGAKKVGEVRWPDGHTFFAFLHRACPARERSMGAQALGPGAASPSGMIVILALCQNNTPPALQEGPGGLRREEAWGGLRRSEGSGLG